MKIQVYDTNGNDYGIWTRFGRLETYMPCTIDGLANEQGVQITTHGTPYFCECLEEDCLKIRPQIKSD